MENFLDLKELISLSSLQSFANDKVILFYNASNIRDLEAKVIPLNLIQFMISIKI